MNSVGSDFASLSLARFILTTRQQFHILPFPQRYSGFAQQ